MTDIPESHHDLLNSQIPVTLATVTPDGMPHTTVLWFQWDGENVLMSTTESRKKTENLKELPKASLMMIDPENMYRYLELRGTVEITEVGTETAYDLIDTLAEMYTGKTPYYGNLAPEDGRQKETRVILKFVPEHVVARG